MTSAPTISAAGMKPSILRELLFEQFPLIGIVVVLGIVTAYAQHGFLPGGNVAFPLAGVKVPIWHIVWMGFWTGYTTAMVGQAAGIFALPYTMSVLQFVNPHVTPTMQLLTFLNPFGALFGFHRNRQWNVDFALWVCLGGVLGGLLGPFIRLTVLSDVEPFTFATGLGLSIVGIHLCYEVYRSFREKTPDGIEAKFRAEMSARRAAGLSPSGIPAGLAIETLSKGSGRLVIGFWGETWTLRLSFLFVAGAGVGALSAALGIGGGFLLVPIFAAVYRMPMYILVAATIPFAVVLSAVGLFTYDVIMPAVTGVSIEPEWSWGMFAAAGGILGSWIAAKTQRFVPEHFLKLMLGGMTVITGALYVVSCFYEFPFQL